MSPLTVAILAFSSDTMQQPSLRTVDFTCGDGWTLHGTFSCYFGHFPLTVCELRASCARTAAATAKFCQK